MMSDKYDTPYIDEEERELMESLEQIDVDRLSPPSKKRIDQLKTAAREHLKRASTKMNIRISPEELALIKERADREGLKYQTLVKSVMHKYVTGRLVEANRDSG